MTPAMAARAERRLALAHELTSRALLDDSSRLWPAVAAALIAHFGCERATIFAAGERGLRSLYAHGLETPLEIPKGHGLVGAAAVAGRPVVANAAYADPRFDRSADGATGFATREALAFALAYRGRCVGVVELLNKAGGFSDADAEDAAWLADGLSVIFAKAAAEDEKAHLARRMAQVEKMSALGRMAAGIAHEVNNPLMAILGFAGIIMRQPKTPPESLPLLLKIDAEVRRIQKLVADLLGFSRGAAPAMAAVDLKRVAEETLELAAPELKRRMAQGSLEAPAALPAALGDGHALKQVLLNLVLNAAQAIDGRRGGGRVSIRLSENGGRLRVEVVDDGPGVPQEMLDRVFEPFYTTKADGTGLGLFISGEIVRRHGGRLTGANRPEGGASFSFELPRA